MPSKTARDSLSDSSEHEPRGKRPRASSNLEDVESAAKLSVTSPTGRGLDSQGRPMEPWMRNPDDKADEMIASLICKVSEDFIRVTQRIVPWYLRNFPASYFQEVGDATRAQHLKGLAAMKGIDQDISLMLSSQADDGACTEVTICHTTTRPGTLQEMLEAVKLPAGKSRLRRVKVFDSLDGTVSLNVFTYDLSSQALPQASLEDFAAGDDVCKEDLADYLKLCEPAYVRHSPPQRLMAQRQLYERVRGTEDVRVVFEPHYSPEGKVQGAWVLLAAANVRPQAMLTKVAMLLTARGLNVERLFLDLVRDPSNDMGEWCGSVAMIRILIAPASPDSLPSGVQPFPGDKHDLDSAPWHELIQDLRRVRWLDSTVLNLALKKRPGLGMARAEVLVALCSMLHGPLSKLNAFAFSRPNLLAVLEDPKYARYTADIAGLFMARFDPKSPLPKRAFEAQAQALRERISALQGESARLQLLKMVDAVGLTLRTNLFVPNRYALALRVDPSLMMGPEKEQAPFGVLFVHGESFDGFHNRFQNIARGGLRIVTPGSAEQHAIESARCYDEVYGLSFAQQLKNKDIPEGGAKAVVLVDVTRVPVDARSYTMRSAVKAFTDALLDLIVSVERTRRHLVDYLGAEELLYLGPDEQVIPEDINWIVGRAAQRGYPIPAAFMSSKPAAGINHKEFGVTSEGVVVFLDVALRDLGIQPDKQPFTVKITGGPDGDVAGNLMRILFRDYGANVRIVGVADGSGCAEDPAGLPQSELMRLFEAALPIAALDATKLGPEGLLHTLDTEEGVMRRNSMHSRVKADVFVPAGGRPNTIHKGNWREFLDPVTGEPSSPLVVEGANIFITPEARQALHEHGRVRIVKDSSANKCGVITSSFEICASMLLEEREFLAIKAELVSDVLQRLRELARLEAELLFREYNNHAGSLPHVSERISRAINRAKEAIGASLAGMQRGDETYRLLMPLFLEKHLPRKLVEVAGDRVDSRIPLDYVRNAFASCLASRLLYREGVHFLELQSEGRLADMAQRYVCEEGRIERLLAAVAGPEPLGEAERDEVVRLLRFGGVRSALHVH